MTDAVPQESIASPLAVAGDLPRQEREVGALKAEVAALRSALDASVNERRVLLARLSHDLRNPLSPLVTALEVLKTNARLDSLRIITVMERQVRELTRVLDSLDEPR